MNLNPFYFKKVLAAVFSQLLFIVFTSQAQETLQTVTNRGYETSHPISLGGTYVNTNTTKLFIKNTASKTWALSSGANMISEMGFHIYNWSDNPEFPLFSISNNGMTGIGTALPSSKLTVNAGENAKAIEIVGGNYYESSNSYSFPALSFYSTINAVKSAIPTSEIRFVDRPGTYGYAANVRTSDIEFYTSRNWDGSIYTHVPSLTMTIKSNQDGGYVGIGTAVPKEKLSVNGKIRAHEIKVEQNNWPDYVFSKNYSLQSLADIEKYIKEKGHLPEVPSAEDVAKAGVELGTNQALLLKKIEELTLHLIQMEKRMNEQDKEIKQLKNKKEPK
ncbi:hypothetical protein ACTJIJ_22400 [Niabella sp. 22666]|uniref:hypothetical protein n=1 Tax=Niabella sp. 22666 TaxID=3453954 RepID=UPI003F85AF21